MLLSDMPCLRHAVGASATVRCHVLAPDMRRKVPFLSAGASVGDPTFALPCQGTALLPGEVWWGASAIVPSRVRALAQHLEEPISSQNIAHIAICSSALRRTVARWAQAGARSLL